MAHSTPLLAALHRRHHRTHARHGKVRGKHVPNIQSIRLARVGSWQVALHCGDVARQVHAGCTQRLAANNRARVHARDLVQGACAGMGQDTWGADNVRKELYA